MSQLEWACLCQPLCADARLKCVLYDYDGADITQAAGGGSGQRRYFNMKMKSHNSFRRPRASGEDGARVMNVKENIHECCLPACPLVAACFFFFFCRFFFFVVTQPGNIGEGTACAGISDSFTSVRKTDERSRCLRRSARPGPEGRASGRFCWINMEVLSIWLRL